MRDLEFRQVFNQQPYKSRVEKILTHYKVVLAYLFGSQAEGKAGPLSDVDIAVLLKSDVSPDEWGSIQLALINELSSLFGRNDIDVVILNNANPLLAHRVIYNGQVIFEADPLSRTRFEVETLHRYEDTKPLRRLRQVYLERRISARAEGR